MEHGLPPAVPITEVSDVPANHPGQPGPGMADEFARRWQAFARQQRPELPGFQHAYAAVDRASGAGVVVTVWDQLPDQSWTEHFIKEFRSQVQDLIIGAPLIAECAVLADVERHHAAH